MKKKNQIYINLKHRQEVPKTNSSSGSLTRFCSKKSIPLQNVCFLLTGHCSSSHNWGGDGCGGGGGGGVWGRGGVARYSVKD